MRASSLEEHPPHQQLVAAPSTPGPVGLAAEEAAALNVGVVAGDECIPALVPAEGGGGSYDHHQVEEQEERIYNPCREHCAAALFKLCSFSEEANEICSSYATLTKYLSQRTEAVRGLEECQVRCGVLIITNIISYVLQEELQRLYKIKLTYPNLTLYRTFYRKNCRGYIR